jgi:hypothetical protein
MIPIPNPLLWLGWWSEPVVAGTLVLVSPIAAVFELAQFPPASLGPIALAPLVVLLADTVHKRLLWRHGRSREARGLSGSAA